MTADILTQLPSKEDTDGAILALFRIQDTYGLPTYQLANGFLGLSQVKDEAPPLSGLSTLLAIFAELATSLASHFN